MVMQQVGADMARAAAYGYAAPDPQGA